MIQIEIEVEAMITRVRYLSIQSASFHPYFWIAYTNAENLSFFLLCY